MTSPLKRRLILRAEFLQKTRDFFSSRSVVEVDTRLIQSHSVTDPYMSAFKVSDPQGKFCGYLQTSPEYAMKKLLCNGSGDIFQLSKMFRANENGPMHATEFTMLEWYRVGIDHHQLIKQVCEFIVAMVGDKKRELLTYQQAFIRTLNIDPFEITQSELHAKCRELVGEIPNDLTFDNLLTLLFADQIEKRFDPNLMTVVYDFPASQASLAKTRLIQGREVADRFEVYLSGVELANGFNELTDANLQLARFKQDNQLRRQMKLPEIEIDMDLIEALRKGLPDCAGVALGLDRLMMIALNHPSIDHVITQ